MQNNNNMQLFETLFRSSQYNELKTLLLNISEEMQEHERIQLISKQVSCNEAFYGRDSLLSKIHSVFTTENKKVAVLSGMAGIGKSETVKHYAIKYSSYYDSCVFLNYSGSILQSIIDDNQILIKGVNRKRKDDNSLQTDMEYAEFKLNKLCECTSPRTLIIVDNYDTLDDPDFERFVLSGQYKVLVTTRFEQDYRKYHCIHVDPLSDDALKELIINRCAQEYISIDPNEQSFRELFEMTGKHTLSIEIIANYMAEHDISQLSQMLNLLRENGFAVISNEGNKNDCAFTLHGLFRLAELTESEIQLLRNVALMPSAGIRQDYLRRWCNSDLYNARKRLLKMNIMHYDEEQNKVSLHPLVRQAVQDDLGVTFDLCSNFICKIIEDIDEIKIWDSQIDVKDDIKAYVTCIWPYLLPITAKTYNAAYTIAVFMNMIDDYLSCIDKFNELSKCASTVLKNFPELIATNLFRLGWINSKYGYIDKALKYLSEATDIFNNLYCDSSIITSQFIADYVNCLCTLASTDLLKYQENFDRQSYINGKTNSESAFNVACDAVNRLQLTSCRRRMGLAASTISKFYLESKDSKKAQDYLNIALDCYEQEDFTQLDRASVYVKLGTVKKINGDPSYYFDLICAENIYRTRAHLGMTYIDCLKLLAEHYETHGDLEVANTYWQEAFDLIKNGFLETNPIFKELEEHCQSYKIIHTVNKVTEEIEQHTNGITSLSDKDILSMLQEISQSLSLLHNKVDLLPVLLAEQISSDRSIRKQAGILNEDNEAELRSFFDQMAEKLITNLYQSGNPNVDFEENTLRGIFGDYWDCLDDYTRRSLVSARVFLSGSNSLSRESLDYSGVVISATSALENELKLRFFDGYQAYLRNLFKNDFSKWPRSMVHDGRTENTVFTIGSLPGIFGSRQRGDNGKRFFNKKMSVTTVEKALLDEYLRTILYRNDDDINVFFKEDLHGLSFLDRCEDVRCVYRNAAAHTESLSLEKATNCCRDIIGFDRYDAAQKVGQIQGLILDLVRLSKISDKTYN